jgi:hypothetical protein
MLAAPVNATRAIESGDPRRASGRNIAHRMVGCVK